MKRYSIIYADPPWPYDNQQDHDPARGGYTYQPMTIEDICALPVAQIAAKHCGLFIWATMPKLPLVFEVIKAWGFQHTTTAFTWVKLNPTGEVVKEGKDVILKNGVWSGQGYWTNGNAELCIYAKIGSPQRDETTVKQIVFAPQPRSHSSKPSEVRDRIVALMGDLPRLELFARERVEGWDAWGNEVESDIRFDGQQVLSNSCEVCGGPMPIHRKGPPRKTCSDGCRKKLSRSQNDTSKELK